MASSKGVSAVRLAEMLDVSYPTAGFMVHRIRVMMAEANPILSGVIEVDEMCAGALPRKRAKPSRDRGHSEPSPANPREANPYFGGVRFVAVQSCGCRKAIQKSTQALPLGAQCFTLIVSIVDDDMKFEIGQDLGLNPVEELTELGGRWGGKQPPITLPAVMSKAVNREVVAFRM